MFLARTEHLAVHGTLNSSQETSKMAVRSEERGYDAAADFIIFISLTFLELQLRRQCLHNAL
jgi:hypothetical protein